MVWRGGAQKTPKVRDADGMLTYLPRKLPLPGTFARNATYRESSPFSRRTRRASRGLSLDLTYRESSPCRGLSLALIYRESFPYRGLSLLTLRQSPARWPARPRGDWQRR